MKSNIVALMTTRSSSGSPHFSWADSMFAAVWTNLFPICSLYLLVKPTPTTRHEVGNLAKT